jgi:biopolymer transport protein ExbD
MYDTNDLATTGFIPFLDILLSAIGIFLLIIALQKITDQVDASSAQADIVVVVQADNKLIWINLKEQKWIKIQHSQLTKNINTLVEHLKKSVNLIIAFSANNLDEKRNIDYKLKDFAKNPNMSHINFRIVWWPLSSQSSAVENFLSHWGLSLTNENKVIHATAN